MQLGGPDAAAHMQQRQQQMQVNNILQIPIYICTNNTGRQILKNVVR